MYSNLWDIFYGIGKNQVSTFLDNNGGPGVQHIAFHTDDIISTTAKLRKQGLSVIQPPMEYYSLPVSQCYIIDDYVMCCSIDSLHD